jgi:hypothetical protein
MIEAPRSTPVPTNAISGPEVPNVKDVALPEDLLLVVLVPVLLLPAADEVIVTTLLDKLPVNEGAGEL